ncbi:MAG TPA: MFS transporter [Candidatus Saccharimonadia bacterium]
MPRNIRKLQALNLLAGFVLWYPIEKLFLLSIGVGPLGISVNAVEFIIILLLLDVPSGILADRWRRKHVLTIAFLCMLAGSAVGAVSHNLWQYLVATLGIGGFVALTQGTFQALMYDSLKDAGRQAHYDREQGRAYALFLGGLGLSSVAGGYVRQWFGYPAAYWITVLVMAIATIITLLLHEPQAHRQTAVRRIRDHLRDSWQLVRTNQLLMQLALLITAMSLLRNAQNEYSALLFIALGLAFGWIAQNSNVFNAYAAIALIGVVYLGYWIINGRRILRTVSQTV